MLPDKIEIIEKDQLMREQIAYLRERVAATEHRFDPGPRRNWEATPSSFMFVVLDKKSKTP